MCSSLKNTASPLSFHFPHFLNSQTWIFSLTARGKPRCSAAVTDTSRGSPRPHTPRCGFLSPQHKKHRFPFRLESKPTAASLTHPGLLGNYRRPPPFVRTSTAVLLVRNSSAFSTSTSTPRVFSKSSRKLCLFRDPKMFSSFLFLHFYECKTVATEYTALYCATPAYTHPLNVYKG